MPETGTNLAELYVKLPTPPPGVSEAIALIAATDPKVLYSARTDALEANTTPVVADDDLRYGLDDFDPRSRPGVVKTHTESALARQINLLNRRLSRPIRWAATIACGLVLGGVVGGPIYETAQNYPERAAQGERTALTYPSQEAEYALAAFTALIATGAGAMGGSAISKRFLDDRVARRRAQSIVREAEDGHTLSLS